MSVWGKVTGAVSGILLLAVGIWATAKYSVLGALFSTSYMAHRFCYLLEPRLVWTNAASDGLIWLSYVAIAVALAALLRRTRKLLAFRWVFVAFGLFIVACGFTHFFEMVTLWTPLYWLSTSIKVLTAVASVATAIAFAPLVPRAAEAIRLFHDKYSKSEEERVATLSKLADTEERMRLAVESAGVGTWDYNPTTRDGYWDTRCRAIFGLDGGTELKHEDFLERIHPEDRQQVEALINTAFAEHREYNAAYRIVTTDGETRHVIARGKPVDNHGHHPLRLTGTVLEVTRERQAEEALLKTEKLAVAGRMAASIAHEINNPLGAAVGLVYLARNNDSVPPDVRHQLEMAEQELNRAGQITQSTLSFYRESPNPVQTNPVEVVQSVLRFLQPKIRKAGVDVQRDFIHSKPMHTYPGELRQIVTNLVSNAIEATPSGGKVFVRVHPARDWRSRREGYRIVVADSGSGIPPETRKKLFEPFQTTKGEKGTGLGLWITRQLVQKHGGFVNLRSRYGAFPPNSGTTFAVWLPLSHEFSTAEDDRAPA